MDTANINCKEIGPIVAAASSLIPPVPTVEKLVMWSHLNDTSS